MGWPGRALVVDDERGAHSDQAAEGAFATGEYPNLAAFITDHAMKPGYDFADEFEVGLDVILDGLERVRDAI
jgi:hypothetical protein